MNRLENILWAGDAHLKLSELETAGLFQAAMLAVIRANKPKITVFPGDLLDKFGIINAEVLALWNDFLEEARQLTHLWLQVGNHDMSAKEGGSHALEVFKGRENVTVFDSLAIIPERSLAVMPFVRDIRTFEAQARSVPAGYTLLAHNSVNGCQFDNGFYDPHGVDPDCTKHLAQVISGHVHRTQEVTNWWYPGTGYQQGKADAGQLKCVYLGNINEKGIWETTKQIDLDLPTYEVIKVEKIADLILPEPNPKTTYWLEATGTHQEIKDLKKSEIYINFCKQARRVHDNLQVIRTQMNLPQLIGRTLKDKFVECVNSKEWKVPKQELIDAANGLF